MADKKKAVPTPAPATGDKKKALETAIEQIEKTYGKGSIMRLGDDIPVNVEAISTGSLARTWPSVSAVSPAAASSRYSDPSLPAKRHWRSISSPALRKTARGGLHRR
jgi:hypothetical protein